MAFRNTFTYKYVYSSLIIFLISIILNSGLYNSKLFLNLHRTNTTNSLFLKVKSFSSGDYITDKNGMALYIFQDDLPNKSNCVGECEKKWAPFLAEDVTFPPDVDPQLDPSMVGLLRRAGGKYQATYNKQPLYKYKLDLTPEDRLGHRKKDFRGYWSLIRPDGTPLDSRIGSSLNKFTNVKGVNLVSTGFASIILVPDIYILKVNLTQTGKDLAQVLIDVQANFDMFNSTVLGTFNNDTKIITLEKRITNYLNNVYVSQSFETSNDDIKKVIALMKKLNDLNEANSQFNFTVNFAISEESMNNAKSLVYGRAIKDAVDNAEILLNPLKLEIDGENGIKSINLDSVEIVPVGMSSMGGIAYNAKMVNLKANVSYNIKKK